MFLFVMYDKKKQKQNLLICFVYYKKKQKNKNRARAKPRVGNGGAWPTANGGELGDKHVLLQTRIKTLNVHMATLFPSWMCICFRPQGRKVAISHPR